MAMRIDWQRLIPRYWFQNYPTSWEWDALLNELLDQHPISFGYLTVTIGGAEVWAGNYPYAYGHPYAPEMQALPSVATRRRLRRAIEGARLDKIRAAALSRIPDIQIKGAA
jgi:hypothetical protein